jgi:hypothetical protein
MLAYRWHNYNTYDMIKDTKVILSEYPNSIVIDWWCRNVSKLWSYKEMWINNQIITYNSTWEWWTTLWFTSRFIEKYLRKPDEYKDREITLALLSHEILDIGSYAIEFMKFPWNLIDITLEVENWKLKPD